ncbi:MAG TPA: saccharopine dehydrogenase NADP-binding domain-containing protein [Streptosporangiaceae bacterium]
MTWLLYGAYGFTGTLVARLAVARGERPVLAGRSAGKVAELAGQLGLEHRVFGLTDPDAIRRGLDGVSAVAHCAGPFSATAGPMARACINAGLHYLDVTGEIAVFEELHGLGERARAAGSVLLPGAGFDVVPTDCAAALLAAALPGARRLDLAFLAGGGPSPGTAKTAVEGMRTGGQARIDGVITTVPMGWRTIQAAFPSGPRTATSVPWGDVSTAWYSTGIPDITTYTVVPAAAMRANQALGLAKLLRLGPALRLARALAGRAPGPDEQRRARTRAEVWGRASDGERSVQITLVTPNAYDLTADSVVRAVTRLGSVSPGVHTPSTAFGPRYVTELDGVTLTGPAPG